jgi:PIN domain nuclease of toxin-antitoxin system
VDNRLFYVSDTHSLLWHIYDVPRLGPNAKTAFNAVNQGDATLLIPAIVLAEMVYIVERRRHDIDVGETLDQIAKADNFQVLPFDLDGARALISLTEIPELHDRMIVAAAHVFGVPLITRDETIRQAGVVECIW